jgi:hypothetical protein
MATKGQSLSRLTHSLRASLTAACSFACFTARPGRRAAPTATAFHPLGASASLCTTSSRASVAINGLSAEFDQWRWERLDRVADLVVPFRREVYKAVVMAFAEFATAPG